MNNHGGQLTSICCTEDPSMVLVLRAVPVTLPWTLDTILAVSTSRRSYKHRERYNVFNLTGAQ